MAEVDWVDIGSSCFAFACLLPSHLLSISIYYAFLPVYLACFTKSFCFLVMYKKYSSMIIVRKSCELSESFMLKVVHVFLAC